MQDLLKETYSNIKGTEFSIVLFYAKGCKWCEKFKPEVEALSKEFPMLGFYKAELGENYEQFVKYAEKEPEFKYEAVEGSEETIKVPVMNEDGTPAMTVKISVPCFYLYHTKAATLEEPLGYIGGLDNTSIEELRMVCNDLVKIMYGS